MSVRTAVGLRLPANASRAVDDVGTILPMQQIKTNICKVRCLCICAVSYTVIIKTVIQWKHRWLGHVLWRDVLLRDLL